MAPVKRWYELQQRNSKIWVDLRYKIEESNLVCQDSKLDVLPVQYGQTIKNAVAELAKIADPKISNAVCVPAARDLYANLFIDAVRNGSIPMMSFLVKECGVDPNLCTPDLPNILHVLGSKVTPYHAGNAKVITALFNLGLKKDGLNRWNLQGNDILHSITTHIADGGYNATRSFDEFLAWSKSQGKPLSHMPKQQYEAFVAHFESEAADWFDCAKLLVAQGARHVPTSDGKYSDDILKARNCTAPLCVTYANYLAALIKKSPDQVAAPAVAPAAVAK